MAREGPSAVEKPQPDAVEFVEEAITQKDAALDAAVRGQVASGYETLGAWETVKTFKYSVAVCFFAAFSAATDGYQIGLVSPLSHPRRKKRKEGTKSRTSNGWLLPSMPGCCVR